ncbi:MAG: hypothetical protein WBA74_04655 [Cyclobacteriaceae bacterium]
MKKILTVLGLIAIVIVISPLELLPWWSFLVPVFFLGLLLPLKKWAVLPFVTGFSSGFIAWVFSTLYFEITFQGEIIKSISTLMELTTILIYLAIGLIGGLLVGLAVYAGYLLRNGREILKLKLPYK